MRGSCPFMLAGMIPTALRSSGAYACACYVAPVSVRWRSKPSHASTCNMSPLGHVSPKRQRDKMSHLADSREVTPIQGGPRFESAVVLRRRRLASRPKTGTPQGRAPASWERCVQANGWIIPTIYARKNGTRAPLSRRASFECKFRCIGNAVVIPCAGLRAFRSRACFVPAHKPCPGRQA